MATLMDQIRGAIRDEVMCPIFTKDDLANAKISDPHNNLPNYDKKNSGSSNRNKKVLVSRKIHGDLYYAFDETLFPEA